MVFPQWQFPTTLPFLDLPRQLLQAQLNKPLQLPVETVIDLMRHKVRQLALDNRHATAHAAMRLAEGISAFHRQHMTPFLAAFSNSALVLVRLGQLLEQGQLSDGHTALLVTETVRQGLYVNNIVTFGYPLPNGQVAAALLQRLRGTFVNVVPAQCWKQWQGNFLLRGEVQNLPVAWAPGHASWPRLAPQSPEVAELGALLGGPGTGRRVSPNAPLAQRQQGLPAGVEMVWDALCTEMQRFNPVGVLENP
jgi:hypothetical protein